MLMVTNGCAFFSSAHSFLFTMCFLVLSFLLVNLLEVPFYSLLLKSKRLFILMVVGFCLQLIIVSSVSSLPFHFLSLFSLKKYIIIWSFLFGLGSLNLVEIGAKDWIIMLLFCIGYLWLRVFPFKARKSCKGVRYTIMFNNNKHRAHTVLIKDYRFKRKLDISQKSIEENGFLHSLFVGKV